MGPIKLDSKITGQMKTWGSNYNSMEGCNHDAMADKLSPKINSKDVTLNVMSEMDASHAKPNSMNPGCDQTFWSKGNPQMGTVGEGKLSRSKTDSRDRM